MVQDHGAVFLSNYNVMGDGTVAALAPLLIQECHDISTKEVCGECAAVGNWQPAADCH